MNVEFENGRPKGYLTIREFASKSYVHPNSVRRYIRIGKIQATMIGNTLYIKEGTPYPEPEKRGAKFKKDANSNDPESLQIFAERLSLALKNSDLAFSDFAKMMGFSYATARNYVHGRRHPTLKMAIEISKKLHISLDWLCDTGYC